MRPELHPASAAFPQLPDIELKALAEDIRQNGLIEPVVMLGGLLLDGRCRWDACEIAGVEPRTVEHGNGDPVGFVLSKNLHRRQLNTSQKAMVAARLANLQNGTNQYRQKVGPFSEVTHSTTDLAKLSEVSAAQIQFAKRVLTQGAPHIIHMVETGSVRAQVAAEAIKRTSREDQATWTQKDVEREGYKVIHAFPSNQRVAKAARKRANVEANGEQPRTIHVPYPTTKLLTDMPSGDEPGGRAEIRREQGYSGVVEHQRRYGRTPLHPDKVKDLMICDNITGSVAAPIVALNKQLDAEQFFDAIDQMLAWVPEADKTNGMQIDFARKARATLASLEAALPATVKRLTALLEALRARKADRGAAESARLQLH